MVRLQVEEIAAIIGAVQVRVKENSWGQLPGVVMVENVGVTSLSQASEAES
jgi:hypothetical protein